jgi:hypothetical protein
MFNTLSARLALAAAATLASSGAMAVSMAIDVTNPNNGLTNIFSTTFAGPNTPCNGSSPSYCSFFGGLPTAGQLAAISVSPNPSGVTSAVPLGIAPVPVAGSFLDLTLSGGNTLLTLNGGTITLGNASITVVPVATTATISGAGFVFDSTLPPTTAVNGLGQAEFLVTLASPFAIDFSAFPSVVTSCVGNAGVCAAIGGGGLFLDAVRYRLAVEFDPTYTQFNAKLIGQTSNNSMFFANLSTVPVPAAAWLMGSALGLLGWIRRKAIA